MKSVHMSPLTARLVQIATLGAVALMASSANAGISNTKHNLGATGSAVSGNVNNTTGTDEICVFCHTPHGANTNAVVPLWNKGFSSATYTTYKSLGTSTLDAAELGVGSVSLACLSCHDGTQAMDNMVNAPGSGGYNATGASQNYTWTGSNQSSGKLATGIITNLTADLRNDHPIGIQYCGGWGSGTLSTSTTAAAWNGTCADPDFVSPAGKTMAAGTSVWWVDTTNGGTGNSLTREKTDMILYTRDFGTAMGTGPSVECASCHDPHVEKKATNQVAFLRVTQTGSGVCLACHVK